MGHLIAQRAARAAPSVYKRHVPLIPALVRREAAVLFFLIAFLSQKLEHRLHETQYSGSMLFFSALTSCEIARVGQVLEQASQPLQMLRSIV